MSKNKIIYTKKLEKILVSSEDYERLNQYNWYRNKDGYFTSIKQINKKRYYFRLHRLILNAKSGQIVDHINRICSDNRRCNLRIISQRGNNCNTSKRKNTTSKYLGVRKKDNKWIAQIKFNYKTIHLGSFVLEKDAAKAYDIAAKIYHKEYANLNFK